MRISGRLAGIIEDTSKIGADFRVALEARAPQFQKLAIALIQRLIAPMTASIKFQLYQQLRVIRAPAYFWCKLGQ